MKISHKLFITSLLLGILTSVVAADEEDSELVPWSGNVQFGYSASGGNTEDSNLNGAVNFLYKKDKWLNTYKFSTLQGRSSAGTNADRYAGILEFNYNFEKRVYTFLHNSNIYDKFATYDVSMTTAIGYGTRVYQTEDVSIDVQGGPGFRYARVSNTTTYDRNIIAYLGSTLIWQVSENATFQQTASLEAGSDNTLMQAESSLTTNLVGDWNLQASFVISNNSKIPPGSNNTKQTDYRTSMTLLYNF